MAYLDQDKFLINTCTAKVVQPFIYIKTPQHGDFEWNKVIILRRTEIPCVCDLSVVGPLSKPAAQNSV